MRPTVWNLCATATATCAVVRRFDIGGGSRGSCWSCSPDSDSCLPCIGRTRANTWVTGGRFWTTSKRHAACESSSPPCRPYVARWVSQENPCPPARFKQPAWSRAFSGRRWTRWFGVAWRATIWPTRFPTRPVRKARHRCAGSARWWEPTRSLRDRLTSAPVSMKA